MVFLYSTANVMHLAGILNVCNIAVKRWNISWDFVPVFRMAN